MNIREQRQQDVVILNLDGNLMGGPEAVSLTETIFNYIDKKEFKVVVDLENVERMNSSGLGILIKALSTFRNNGGELKLANVSSKIENLLVITKLNTVFETFATVDDAVNSF